MEEKNKACFHPDLCLIFLSLWVEPEVREIGKVCFLSSLAPTGHGFTVRFIGPFVELTLLYRLLAESYSPAVYFIFSNPRERMSDRINV